MHITLATHVVMEDDTYEGYFIPKRSIVYGNIWFAPYFRSHACSRTEFGTPDRHFLHDPDIYHDPMAFKPERFLKTADNEPERDPRTILFGFGRRICPGRELADPSVFMEVAMSLAVFNIRKARDEYGHEIDVSYEMSPGIIK